MVNKTKIAPVVLATSLAVTNPALAEATQLEIKDTSKKVDSSLSVTPNYNGLDVTRTTKNSMVNFSLESLADSPIVGINAGIYKGQKGAFIDVKKGENITSVFVTGTFNGENISSQATIGKMQKDFEGKNIGQIFFGAEVSLEVTDNLAVGAYANKTNTESKDLKSWTETKKVIGGTEITTYNERFNGYGKEAVGGTVTYLPTNKDRLDINFGQAKTDEKNFEYGVGYEHLTDDLRKKFGFDFSTNSDGDYSIKGKFSRKVGLNSELSAFVGSERINGEKDNFVGGSYTFYWDLGKPTYDTYKISKNTYNPYSHVVGADEASRNLYGEKEFNKSVEFIPDLVKNIDPEIHTDGVFNSLVGQSFSLEINATDKNNDFLTYEAFNLPKGLKIDGNKIVGNLEEATDEKGQIVTIRVNDGKGGIVEKNITIKIFVSEITGIPFSTEKVQDNTMNVGEERLVQKGLAGLKTIFKDKNGKIVSEKIVTNPTNEIIAIGTKTPNNIPTFLTSGEFKTKVGENFSLEIKAEDRDNDTLTYNFSNLPTWLNVSGNKLSGTPDKSGKYTFTVEVNDGKGGIVSKEFSVDVEAKITPITSINNIPEITIKGNTSGIVGENFNLDVEVTDKEDNFDVLTILVEGLPAGLNFDKTSISGTPSVSGKYSVKITAIDTKGAKREKTVVLNIAEKPNNAPEIKVTGNLNGRVGKAYSLSLNTIDIDNDDVTLSFDKPLPSGLIYDSNTKTIFGTPMIPGKYTIKATAKDSKNVTTEKFLVLDIAANNAPVITTTGSLEGKVGENYTLTINSTDSDNDNVTVKVEGLPAGLTFSEDRISGTPTTAGTYQIKIIATDGITETVENKTITIAEKVNVNSLPEITTTGSLNGKVFENYSLTVNATDNEDGDNVEISVNNLPAGLTFSRNKISGTPKKHGNYSVEIIATDKNGGQTKKTIEINIEAPEKITENPVSDIIEITYREGNYRFPQPRDGKGIKYKTEGLTGFTYADEYWINAMDDVGTFNIKVTLIDEYYGTEITKNVTLISKPITRAPYHIEAKVGDIIDLESYGENLFRVKRVSFMKKVEGPGVEFEAVKPGVYEYEYYGITEKGYGRKGGDIHTIAKAIITITE